MQLLLLKLLYLFYDVISYSGKRIELFLRFRVLQSSICPTLASFVIFISTFFSFLSACAAFFIHMLHCASRWIQLHTCYVRTDTHTLDQNMGLARDRLLHHMGVFRIKVHSLEDVTFFIAKGLLA